MDTAAFEDLPYRTVEGEALLGRLYRPHGTPRAVVVEVHGGAWTQNDRSSNAAIHAHLAQAGFAVFALDFRLAPKHRYPAPVNDVNYGIRWIQSQRARLGLGAAPVGALGTSSGGHQLALAALLPDDPRFRSEDAALAGADGRPSFVVACWPILDPLARYRMARAKGLQNLVNAHHAFWPDEAAMAEGNPQRVVEEGRARHLPPMLVLQGTADENVEHERADIFAEAYRRAGGTLELVKYPGQPHTFVPKDPSAPASREALAKMADWISRQVA